MAPTCSSPEFNIRKQCPQIYIYIFAVITSALVAMKYGSSQQVFLTLLSGAITTFILMGINFCAWPFHWLTWILAAVWIIIATSNILIFFTGVPDELKDQYPMA